jgi:transcriptional regulator with XRE-family HTH domain
VDDAEVQRVLARNIRAFSRKKRITLTRLADFTGTGKSQLFRVLRSETSPSVRWLVKVANALDVEPWQLLAPRSR